MAEYIERNKIFSIWRSIPAPASVTSLSAAIHQTPVIDIVRCKNCEWGGKCEIESLLREVDKIPDPYCAAGKRREENA